MAKTLTCQAFHFEHVLPFCAVSTRTLPNSSSRNVRSVLPSSWHCMICMGYSWCVSVGQHLLKFVMARRSLKTSPKKFIFRSVMLAKDRMKVGFKPQVCFPHRHRWSWNPRNKSKWPEKSFMPASTSAGLQTWSVSSLDGHNPIWSQKGLEKLKNNGSYLRHQEPNSSSRCKKSSSMLKRFGDKMDKVAGGLKRFLSTYDSLRCSCCLPFVCLAKLFCSTKEVSLDRDM